MHHEFYHLAQKVTKNYKKKQFALATVIRVQGSAYRREGTRMIIDKAGNWFGNISGGCLEGDILQKAQTVVEQEEPILITYDTRESKNKEIRVALGCSGVIDILLEPVLSETVQFFHSLIEIFESQQTAYLKTELQLIKEKIYVRRTLNQEIPKAIHASIEKNENACHLEKTEFKITLSEKIGLLRKVVIWGSGPDVVPLANFAKQLGWQTIVCSNCGIDSLKKRLPDTEIHLSNFDDFEAKTHLHENTAVLLVSHDFYNDYFILEKIIHKPVKYIGIMGPNRRGKRMLQEIQKRLPDLVFDEKKLHYPIGLDIGSDNPTEIALSIIAEIQSNFSGKNATSLSNKTSRIHDTVSDTTIDEYNPSDTVCSINYFQ